MNPEIMQATNQLIILDRDGVINFDSADYIKNKDEWLPIHSSLRAIAKLNKVGYKVAVATNQSGIARGYFNLAELVMIHKKMQQELAKVGAHIDALEYCPDHPDNAGVNRKPNPGMLNKLLDQFNAIPEKTWFIGDSKSDIDCAINANCQPALVLTGNGKKTLAKGLDKSIPVFNDLSDFVSYLLNKK